ncbi:unnamed protein product [Rotaria sordida]|uniref:Uncharacterized protein n=1 Tax=Rotaria sordida TaxID=392033 RepID=A0A819VBP3_9BILA|nr:unnamed protein product [Rotaria sordida]
MLAWKLGPALACGDGPECGYAIAVHAHIDKVACTSSVEALCNQALFGGFKQSDQERELGRYGLKAYYQVKIIVVKLV